MRRSILSVAILMALGLAHEARAETVFIGSLVYTAASHCSDPNMVGREFASRYYVARLGGNQNKTGISNFHLDSADNYWRGGRWPTTLGEAVGTGIDDFGTQYGVRVRLISSNPPIGNLTANSAFVLITGQIENPEETFGIGAPCVVTFRASYTRRL